MEISGQEARETIMPTVPAAGDPAPNTYMVRQTDNASIELEIAPTRVALRQNRPQTKGPRKAEPIAPQETANMATIVPGRAQARTTESKMNPALAMRISLVRA